MYRQGSKYVFCIWLLAFATMSLAPRAQAQFTKVYQFVNQTGLSQTSVKATTFGLESIISQSATPSAWAPAVTGLALVSGVYNTTLKYGVTAVAAGTSVTLSWQTADASCRLRDLRWGTGVAVLPTQLGGVPGGGMMFHDWPSLGQLTVVITNDTDGPLNLTGVQSIIASPALSLEQLSVLNDQQLVEMRVAAIDHDIDVLRAEVVYNGSIGILPSPSVRSLTGKLDKAVTLKHSGLTAYLAGDLTSALSFWSQAAKSITNFISELTTSSTKGNLSKSLYNRWIVDGGGQIVTAPEIRDALLALPKGAALQSYQPLPAGVPLPPCAHLDPAYQRPWPVALLYPGEYTAFVVDDTHPGAGFIMHGSVLDAYGRVALNWSEQAVVQSCTADDDPPFNASILINGGALYTNSAAVTLDLHAEDNVGVIVYEVTDASGTSAATVNPAETSYSGQIPGALSSGDGVKTVSVRYCDVVGNWSALSEDSIIFDQTGPTITAAATNADGSPYTAGEWTNQDVTVHFECADAGAGLASTPSDITVTSEGITGSVSGTAADNVGNSSTATFGPINIDKTPPTITGSRAPDANANGWTNTDVMVSFTASDEGSGLASVTPDTVVSAEGAGQSVTGTAVDQAGNSATATVGDINIDKTPPTITGSRAPDANANGWNNTDVMVSFTASDEGSGLASVTPDTVVSAEGAGQSVTVTAVDQADNSATATVGDINIDKTPPTITGSRAPDANANGWNNTDVMVSFTASDEGSGLASVTPDSVVSAEGEGQSVTGTAVDQAGNSAGVTVGDINIDKTPPVVTIVLPGTGEYRMGQPGLVATWSATDVLSGVVPPDGGTIPIDTSVPGTGLRVVAPVGTAVDRAGNSSLEASAEYTCTMVYGFLGLLSPYAPPPRSFNTGGDIPLKWQYTDISGNVVNSSAAAPVISVSPIGVPGVPGNRGLEYDNTSNRWHFNWKTDGLAAGVYEILITSTQTGQTDGPFYIELK